MHVHNYMATIPMYLLMLIAVLNWDVVRQLASFHWSGGMTLERMPAPHGSPGYLRGYLAFMTVLCVLPYVEENLRCFRHRLRATT